MGRESGRVGRERDLIFTLILNLYHILPSKDNGESYL